MISTSFLALQSSATGREAFDALYSIFYNELFIGALAVSLVASFVVALVARRAGIVMGGTTLLIGFVGLMSPYLISLIQLATRTSAR